MKILLINHYAGRPDLGMEFRPYFLAREWARSGHEVRILASNYSHLRYRQPQSAQEDVDGVTYQWVPTRPYQGNGAARLWNMAQFIGGVYRRGPALAAWRPHMVIASSTYPYDIWPAARIARKAGAVLVHEIHDLWPLTPRLLGDFSAAHPMIASMQWAENYTCRNADRIVSILPGTKAYLQQHGMPAQHFVHIPNGIDPEAPQETIKPELREQILDFKARYRSTCIYAGGHAVSNALDVLLEVAARPEMQSTGFILLGAGAEKSALQTRARDMQNILFLDPVPKAEVGSALALADMAYLGWRHSPLYDHGISPNKLFDYMLAGLPVIHATDTPYDLVRDAGCGLSVASNDIAGISQAVQRLQETPEAERQALGAKGRDFVFKHHNYSVLAQRFLEIAT
ncbi:glycosyltransferase family 4 protein [Bordetella avium]|uniref:glycosyltransferase family 4 protein n=1 Tax=Bordetella avium TaxID=521 RepID=UPI000E68E7EF|nr:glycosyltransferase family 4 protein [Bordetella avium]RIQ41464.1 glycosyltransferase WbuB [Bordetella avium]RIQ45746.1 glycosyltransferase WbuB [Bordetella avium]RIQ46674.1 glycosyltransferase WbuB [Bordetella avium]RIQ49801.1 glycosyltransferase WbuB [Bordetella avium]RIQ61579.1 glycosyltransferase WbuB [Bordetella avium]